MEISRECRDVTGLSSMDIQQLWATIAQGSPMRRLLEFELKACLKRAEDQLCRTKLTFDEFNKHQGVIEGIERAIGVLSRNDHHSSKKNI